MKWCKPNLYLFTDFAVSFVKLKTGFIFSHINRSMILDLRIIMKMIGKLKYFTECDNETED